MKATTILFFLSASISVLQSLVIATSDTTKDAEQARWLVQQSVWGSVTFPVNSSPFASKDKEPDNNQDGLTALVLPYGNSGPRVFFYLMGSQNIKGAAMTLSEASLNTSLFAFAGCGSPSTDSQDPRCTKLTLAGYLHPCESAEDCKTGKEALFAKHPGMKDWPEDHHFVVHELDITDVWMIANFGGGGFMDVGAYDSAEPNHHPVGSGESEAPKNVPQSELSMPEWSHKVARARWVVYNALWTTLSTRSSRTENSGWGNIRSVVDGETPLHSSGLPIFYLPLPDPSYKDVSENPKIVLSFTEAALHERVNSEGKPCSGMDAGDPRCAQVILTGTAVPVKDKGVLDQAMKAFARRHPLAPWLSEGGSHTDGSYFTIQLTKVVILDYFGGFTEVPVDEYLGYSFVPSSAEAFYTTNCNSGRNNRFDLVMAFASGAVLMMVISKLLQGKSRKNVTSKYDKVLHELELESEGVQA